MQVASLSSATTSLNTRCTFTRTSKIRRLGLSNSAQNTIKRTRPQIASVDDFSIGSKDYILSNGMIDYYEVLGIEDTATEVEIKSAWRSLAKVCHPDISGDEIGHNLCILLNEAYEVLSDAEQRREYNRALDEALADEQDGYTGEPLSKWMANTKMGKNTNPEENRAAFVDELTCIGCKQCVWCAPATFRMEDLHGRSRVFAQWLDTEDNIQSAMEACPVSCIHWIEKQDLPALEYVTQFKVPKVNVGVMMAGQGGSMVDVWDATARYMKDREEKRKARERASKYSKAQAEARAAAASELMRQQQGWFQGIADKLGINDAAKRVYQSMDEIVSGSVDDEYSGYQRVGRRKRTRKPDSGSYGARGENGGRVPADRALVPAAVGRRRWER